MYNIMYKGMKKTGVRCKGGFGYEGRVRYADDGDVGRASRSWVPSEARVRALNLIDPLIGQKSRDFHLQL